DDTTCSFTGPGDMNNISAGLDPSGPLNHAGPGRLRRNQRFYFQREPEPEGIVKKYYKMIFEYELHEWMTPEETWPRNRDLRTFLEWFDVDICTMVIDLSRGALEQEP